MNAEPAERTRRRGRTQELFMIDKLHAIGEEERWTVRQAGRQTGRKTGK